MIPPDLAATEVPAFVAALRQGTQIRCRVNVTDLSHVPRVQIPADRILRADVVSSSGSTVREALTLEALDPEREYGLDDPATLIHLTQWVYVPLLARWVACPMGVFRPYEPTDQGPVIKVEALDKSSLHMVGQPPGTIREGRSVVDAIRSGLEAVGERLFVFPDADEVRDEVQRDVPIGGLPRKGSDQSAEDLQPWPVWRRLADRAGLVLDYDRLGRAWLRRKPDAGAAPLMTFDEGNIGAWPERTRDFRKPNRLLAWGTGNAKIDLSVKASHPLSAENNVINGVPWRNAAVYDENLSRKKLQKWGELTLGRESKVDAEPSVTIGPAWHIEAGDTVEVLGERIAVREITHSLVAGESRLGWSWSDSRVA